MNRLTDRCDSCGAQAFTRWEKLSGLDLLFCSHHDFRHAKELELQGFLRVEDERHTVNVRPSVSANAL